MAEFAYNNWQYSSTDKSPFLVNLGRHSNINGQEQGSLEKVQEANEFIYGIKKTRKEIEEVLRRTNEVMIRRTNKKQGEVV